MIILNIRQLQEQKRKHREVILQIRYNNNNIYLHRNCIPTPTRHSLARTQSQLELL